MDSQTQLSLVDWAANQQYVLKKSSFDRNIQNINKNNVLRKEKKCIASPIVVSLITVHSQHEKAYTASIQRTRKTITNALLKMCFSEHKHCFVKLQFVLIVA